VFSNKKHSVLDTKTGTIYNPHNKTYIEIKKYKKISTVKRQTTINSGLDL